MQPQKIGNMADVTRRGTQTTLNRVYNDETSFLLTLVGKDFAHQSDGAELGFFLSARQNEVDRLKLYFCYSALLIYFLIL